MYLRLDLSSYRRNEKEKKRTYNNRIQLVDELLHPSFFFFCGKKGSVFYKRLTLKISRLRNCDFGKLMNYVRTCLNFRCLLYIRGSGSAKIDYNLKDTDPALVIRQSRLRDDIHKVFVTP